MQVLTKKQILEYLYGDLDGYDVVETVKDYENLYKDSCPATTVAFHAESGKYFALDWQSYESHYGHGEDEYPDDTLYEVKLEEKTVVTKEWLPV